MVEQLQIDLHALSKLGIDLPGEERERAGLPSRLEELLVPCAFRDLSCTLLLVAVKGNRYLAFHVGDGVIGVEVKRAGSSQVMALSMPDNGEFANETYFITSPKAAEIARLVTGRLESSGRTLTGFILMSDGPEAALYNKRKRVLGKACVKLLEANRTLPEDDMGERLYSSIESVIRQKTSDDCSIALMSRMLG